jgi:hypothetical protein
MLALMVGFALREIVEIQAQAWSSSFALGPQAADPAAAHAASWQRLPRLTGDQRIDDGAQLKHLTGIELACPSSRGQ